MHQVVIKVQTKSEILISIYIEVFKKTLPLERTFD